MLLRDALGETLRDARTRQNRTLRDVSTAANVSLGYLSEVERGRKEASSELLASICDALDLELSDLLTTVSSAIRHDALHPAVQTGKSGVVGNSSKPQIAAPVRLDKAAGSKATTGSRHRAAVAAVPAGPAVAGLSRLRIVVPFQRPEAPVR